LTDTIAEQRVRGQVVHPLLVRAQQRLAPGRRECHRLRRGDEVFRRDHPAGEVVADLGVAATFPANISPAVGALRTVPSTDPEAAGMIGQTIGPYHVTAKLGAGGMGEVYRARDTKLGREVAVKILPGLFASDPDRMMRFEREARTLASLNHPHIAQIYGFEETPAGAGHAGVSALVMEMVEGENLSARIARGPIPLDEALPIAGRSPKRSRPRTRRPSSTATSSRPTSRSVRTAR
jgi:hypothetical protein